jgi:hypothetical protein
MKEAILAYFEQHGFDIFFERIFGDNIKRRGTVEWAVLCPYHGDTRPSSSANIRTGKWYCHRCKDRVDIFTLWARHKKLTLLGDFSQVLSSMADEFHIPVDERERSMPAIEYDYFTEDGKRLFTVYRTPDKRFWVSHPKDGEEVNQLPAGPLIPYNLRDVLKSQTVIVVEGEKDVETLRKVGLVGTTNVGGAGKWRDYYSEWLRDKDVAVIPDNDEAGKEHAQKVVASLYGKARSLRYVELPGVGHKGDVSDWVEAGGTKEGLLALIRNTPVSCLDPQLQLYQKCVIDLDEITDFSRETHWLWKDYIPAGEPIIIAGREGDGKTTNCLEIAMEILAGRPEDTIFWIAAEGTMKRTYAQAFELQEIHKGFKVIKHTNGSYLFQFHLEQDLELLENLMTAHHKMTGREVLAVFIDSIRGMSKFNDNESETGKVMYRLNSIICDKHKAALIYLDHFKKGPTKDLRDKISGSTAKTAAVRRVIGCIKTSPEIVYLEVVKDNFSDTPRPINSVKTNKGILYIHKEGKEANEMSVEVDRWMMSLFSKQKEYFPADIKELGKEYGFGDKAIQRSRSRLGIRASRRGKNWIWHSDVFYNREDLPEFIPPTQIFKNEELNEESDSDVQFVQSVQSVQLDQPDQDDQEDEQSIWDDGREINPWETAFEGTESEFYQEDTGMVYAVDELEAMLDEVA